MKSKGANDNGSRRIISLREGIRSGLKILVSAVQSRPCPPSFPARCLLRNPPSVEFVPRFVPNSGTLQRTNAFAIRVPDISEPARGSQGLLAETWGVGRDLPSDLSSRLLLLPQASRGDPTAPLWHRLLSESGIGSLGAGVRVGRLRHGGRGHGWAPAAGGR